MSRDLIIYYYLKNMLSDNNEINNSEHKLMKVAEAASLLRISIATMYRLVSRRAIPFFYVSKSIRLSRDDLQKYLDDHRNEIINWKL